MLAAITSTFMYWLTRLDAFHRMFDASIIIGLLMCLVVILIVVISEGEVFTVAKDKMNDTLRAMYYIYIRSVITVVVLLSIGTVGMTFVPTQKQMAAIIVVPAVMNNEHVQEVAGQTAVAFENLVKLSNSWLEKNMLENSKDTSSK